MLMEVLTLSRSPYECADLLNIRLCSLIIMGKWFCNLVMHYIYICTHTHRKHAIYLNIKNRTFKYIACFLYLPSKLMRIFSGVCTITLIISLLIIPIVRFILARLMRGVKKVWKLNFLQDLSTLLWEMII